LKPLFYLKIKIRIIIGSERMGVGGGATGVTAEGRLNRGGGGTNHLFKLFLLTGKKYVLNQKS
jgi:hypothetical protein